MSNSSIWPKDRIQSDATIPGQSGPRSDGNEGVLYISQSSYSHPILSLTENNFFFFDAYF